MSKSLPNLIGGPGQPLHWLTTPIEFEEERGFRIARKTMHGIVLLVTIALLWAAVTPIRELSMAHGQLVPSSQLRAIQHLEGGIIAEILVKEGEIVEEHQPLIRLNPVAAESELGVLTARAANLHLVEERIGALFAGRSADFADLTASKTTLIAKHLQVYQTRLEHRLKERQTEVAPQFRTMG